MSAYLFDSFYSMDFVYLLIVMAIITWVILKSLFGASSFWNALALAFMGMIFLPLIMGASQTLIAAALLLIVGALIVQRLYWGASFSVAVAAMVVVLIVSSLVNSNLS